MDSKLLEILGAIVIYFIVVVVWTVALKVTDTNDGSLFGVPIDLFGHPFILPGLIITVVFAIIGIWFNSDGR